MKIHIVNEIGGGTWELTAASNQCLFKSRFNPDHSDQPTSFQFWSVVDPFYPDQFLGAVTINLLLFDLKAEPHQVFFQSFKSSPPPHTHTPHIMDCISGSALPSVKCEVATVCQECSEQLSHKPEMIEFSWAPFNLNCHHHRSQDAPGEESLIGGLDSKSEGDERNQKRPKLFCK